MPRDMNEPPPLGPNPPTGRHVEHIDNTNLNNPGNPAGFTALAQASGQKTGADNSGDSSADNTKKSFTLTANGDLTGTATAAQGETYADALAKLSPSFHDYEFESNGKPVNLDDEVKEDSYLNVTKTKKDDSSAGA